MFKLAIISAFLVAVYGAEFINPAATHNLVQNQMIHPDGKYQWRYETENGIKAGEEGVQKPVPEGQANTAQGFYSYPAPHGEKIEIRYTADENGFHAEGNAIPQPHPIPPQIARSLEWIAAHPQLEQRSQLEKIRY